MSINLYPYQQQAVSDLREAYREHLRILLVAPTGSGKTVVFSHIAAAAIERGKRVLILSDRTELFKQTIKAATRHNIPICKIDPDTRLIHVDALLFIGMVETFKRRIDKYAQIKFDLIILDEAHKSAFNKVMDAYPNTKTLGCTATPVGKTLHKYYSHMVQTVDIPDLIRDGFLSPCRLHVMEDDFSDLKTNKEGEYTEESQYSHFNKNKLYDGIIDAWLSKAKGKRTLVFNCNVAHAEKTTAAFNAAGIKSHCITSNTSDTEREWILSEHRRGAFHVLNNANIFIAGYDDPGLECIMMNRATAVINVWLQAAGRGSRILPGKPFFSLIDFGGNFERHGFWDEPRVWTLGPPKKRKKGLGAAPVKSCKACSAVLPAMARECPYCGFRYEPTEKELAQGRLVEVTNKIREAIPGKYTSQLTIPELIELEKTKQLKATYVWRVLRSRGALAIGEYARIKGYMDQWIIRQIEAMENETADGNRVEFMDKKINEIELI